jgi:small multidrug resistance pump
VNRWLMLGAAILSEVAGTLALRAAIDHPAWFVLVGIGYVLAFGLLGAVLAAGTPVGVAYGIWAATGVALTAVLATIVFGDPFTVQIGFGIALVMVGVLLVEAGSHTAARVTEDVTT